MKPNFTFTKTFLLLTFLTIGSRLFVACEATDDNIETDKVIDTNKEDAISIYSYTPSNSPESFVSLDEFTDEFESGYNTNNWDVITSGFPTWDFKSENVTANGGDLDFTIKYDPNSGRGSGNSNYTYATDVYFSSGMLRSKNKTTYGYYEVRMRGTNLQPNSYYNSKLGKSVSEATTKNMGACPAFWLYSDVSAGKTNVSSTPDTNIYYNEIDVIELNQVGCEPETLSQNLHLMTWEGGGYFASASKHPVTGTTETYNCGWDSAEDYHTYACENRPDSIVFYVDNVRVGAKVNSFWHLDEEVGGGMWVTISLGLRAPFEYYDSSSVRCSRETTQEEATASGFPATMSIDYIRAWKRKDDYAEFQSNKRDWKGKANEQ